MSKATRPKKKVPNDGRPEKLNKEIQDMICSVLQRGGYIESAAAYAGISKKTLYNWLKKGHTQKTGKYKNFLYAVRKSQADAEVALLDGIYAAGKKHWAAYQWILAHKFPQRWGQSRVMDEDGSLSYEEPEFLKDEQPDSDTTDAAKEALETD